MRRKYYQGDAAIPTVTVAIPGKDWIFFRDTVPTADFFWESGPQNGGNTIVRRFNTTGNWSGTNDIYSDTDAQAVRIERGSPPPPYPSPSPPPSPWFLLGCCPWRTLLQG